MRPRQTLFDGYGTLSVLRQTADMFASTVAAITIHLLPVLRDPVIADDPKKVHILKLSIGRIKCFPSWVLWKTLQVLALAYRNYLTSSYQFIRGLEVIEDDVPPEYNILPGRRRFTYQ